MNFALSQRRADRHNFVFQSGAERHPIGLAVVVGLHVLLAGVLLSAKLARPPVVNEAKATLLPDQPRTEQPKPHDETKVRPAQMPQQRQIVVPKDFTVDPETPTISGKVDPVQPPIEIAKGDPDNTVHQPLRVLARPAIINAGAAQCRPDYPAVAQRAGITGVSRIRFSVDPSGRVSATQILQASGPTRENRLLDKAAADALAHCPITPGTDEMGRPVSATADVEYVWKLD